MAHLQTIQNNKLLYSNNLPSNQVVYFSSQLNYLSCLFWCELPKRETSNVKKKKKGKKDLSPQYIQQIDDFSCCVQSDRIRLRLNTIMSFQESFTPSLSPFTKDTDCDCD